MGILLAFCAYVVLALSLVLDKYILKRRVVGSSITYVFWIGAVNAVLIPVLFFRQASSWQVAALGVLSGILFLIAERFYFGALERGEATQAPVVTGAFTPIAAAVLSIFILNSPLNIAEQIAFGLLVGGGVIMFLTEPAKLRRVLPWAVASAVFYGAANVIQKLVYNQTSFLAGLALSSLGMASTAAFFLMRPAWRRQIFTRSAESSSKRRFLYFLNRALSAAATLLIFFSIKLEHPAIVDALAGVRAAGVFIFVWLLTKFRPKLLKEHFHGLELFGKVVATIVIVAGLFGLGLERYYQDQPAPPPASVTWGVTFSELMSQKLGLDWKEAYSAILNDLRPQGLRLVAYWEFLEPQKGSWNFADLDWQMAQAANAHIPVILTVGQKVPRWPECHYPDWVNQNDVSARQNELLSYLQTVVEHYRNSPALQYWQVENEPFLNFGACPTPDPAFLDKEIALVRSLDPAHKIILTDGGEFGDWYRAASRADVFGTTLYRRVYSDRFGHFVYPLSPEFYALKRDVVQLFLRKPGEKFIIIEAGLEPWDKKQIYEIPVSRQLQLFSYADMQEDLAYIKQAKFDTNYLWGVEWWYWMKTKQNNSDFWNLAKQTIAHQ